MKTANSNNLAEKVIKTIENKNIKPRPKWEFVLKNYLIWTLAALALIVGSLAFAVIIYLIRNSDWDLYRQISNGWLEFVILTLPYFWLLVFIFLTLLAYYDFKHTKRGYKYRFHLIVMVTLIISLLGGIVFYNSGWAAYIDNVFEEKIPVYRQLTAHRYRIWQRPESGFLAGQIKKIINAHSFTLKDLNGKLWTITYYKKPAIMELKAGLKIKMIGKLTMPNKFEAAVIRPLGRMMHRGMGRPKHLLNERMKESNKF